MKLSKEAISAIIKEHVGDDLAQHLASEIAMIEAIVFDIRGFQSALAEEKRKYMMQTDIIRKRIEAVQLRCHHWQTTYLGDPSGGSDSSRRCDICGKEM